MKYRREALEGRSQLETFKRKSRESEQELEILKVSPTFSGYICIKGSKNWLYWESDRFQRYFYFA